MKTTLLTLPEWEVLFSERCFNPPQAQTLESETAFSNEFEDVLEAVATFLGSEFPEVPQAESASYHLHEYWNWSRVVSVEFETDCFLEKQFIARLQKVLSSLPNAWMVICHCAATAFVSPDEVKIHLVDPSFHDEQDIEWLTA